MKTTCARFLVIVLISVVSLSPLSVTGADYGDKIKQTPEYKKITEGRDDDSDNDYHHHHYSYPYYYPAYPHPSANYRSSSGSGGSSLAGRIYLGLTIGESEFDYDDIDGGDASIFHFGYRPEDSHLGYELSIFDSGNSEVTSLTGIDLEVETINFAITVNSSRTDNSMFNFFGQGGIYLADTRLSGPAASVSEKSNGFLLAVGIEVMVNRHFGLRVEAYHFNEVEDFADDESISAINLGGQFVF